MTTIIVNRKKPHYYAIITDSNDVFVFKSIKILIKIDNAGSEYPIPPRGVINFDKIYFHDNYQESWDSLFKRKEKNSDDAEDELIGLAY